ncbi:MAG: hypothetical protein ACRDLP_00840 [Solirubrobacteraceae bacterium]
MSGPIDVERLLRRALPPVDPPEDLASRLRNTLQSISDMAAEELDGWERVAMRDPRNWVRPALALISGSIAGAGLVLLGRHRAGRVRAVTGQLARAARIVVRR